MNDDLGFFFCPLLSYPVVFVLPSLFFRLRMGRLFVCACDGCVCGRVQSPRLLPPISVSGSISVIRPFFSALLDSFIPPPPLSLCLSVSLSLSLYSSLVPSRNSPSTTAATLYNRITRDGVTVYRQHSSRNRHWLLLNIPWFFFSDEFFFSSVADHCVAFLGGRRLAGGSRTGPHTYQGSRRNMTCITVYLKHIYGLFIYSLARLFHRRRPDPGIDGDMTLKLRKPSSPVKVRVYSVK